MSYRESNIMWEGKRFWVLKDRNAYTVCQYQGTHSLTIQSFALNADGLSIAIAYGEYKEKGN